MLSRRRKQRNIGAQADVDKNYLRWKGGFTDGIGRVLQNVVRRGICISGEKSGEDKKQ